MRSATVYQNVVTQKWYLVIGAVYGLQPIDNRLSPTAGSIGDHVFVVAPATGDDANDVTIFEFQTDSEAFLAQAIYYAKAMVDFESWYDEFTAKSEDAEKAVSGYKRFKESILAGIVPRQPGEKGQVIVVDYQNEKGNDDGKTV